MHQKSHAAIRPSTHPLNGYLGAVQRGRASRSLHAHLSLTELAWEWILAETDQDLLSALWLLAKTRDANLDFHNLRRAVCESRALCLELVRQAKGSPSRRTSTG
jgi:hypothetical protein